MNVNGVLQMKIFCASHIGNSRTNQEDNFFIDGKFLDLDVVRQFSVAKPSVFVDYTDVGSNTMLAVSDGMGGHLSGEVASFLALKHLSEQYQTVLSGDETVISKVISEINRSVSNASEIDPANKDMGATLCGFALQGEKLIGFNVGDSRLYLFDNCGLQQLSRDHSEGQRLLDLKLLSEAEVKNFSSRKAIYKYIGMKTELMADVFNISPCGDGAILLLCTDGLADALNDSEIKCILDCDIPLREKGEKLISEALGKNIGYGDNITIVLTEF